MMRWIDKLLCCHEWKKECDMPAFDVDIFGKKVGEIPREIIRLYVCLKCGKFKKIEL